MAGPKLDDGSAFREHVDERTPMERVATPDEVSGLAVYLASDAASFTTGEVITPRRRVLPEFGLTRRWPTQ